MSASSSSKPKVNLRSTAVKRIMQEASELGNPQDDDFVANPLEVSGCSWRRTYWLTSSDRTISLNGIVRCEVCQIATMKEVCLAIDRHRQKILIIRPRAVPLADPSASQLSHGSSRYHPVDSERALRAGQKGRKRGVVTAVR